MIRILLLILFAVMIHSASAQITEVNPNIKWKFIRSQTIEFSEGRYYQFEFPAETGFDYIFNLSHDTDSVTVHIHVYDLQYQLVKELNDTNTLNTTDLPFDVTSDGTYIVLIKVEGPGAEQGVLTTTVSLVRREKV